MTGGVHPTEKWNEPSVDSDRGAPRLRSRSTAWLMARALTATLFVLVASSAIAQPKQRPAEVAPLAPFGRQFLDAFDAESERESTDEAGPIDREADRALREFRESLKGDGPPSLAEIQRLQTYIEREEDGWVTDGDRRLGFREATEATLRSMSTRARESWSAVYGAKANTAISEALASGDRRDMLRVVRRFPGCEAASSARRWLARDALDRGDALQAARWLDELQREPVHANDAALKSLRALAWRLAGRNDVASRIAASTESLDSPGQAPRTKGVRSDDSPRAALWMSDWSVSLFDGETGRSAGGVDPWSLAFHDFGLRPSGFSREDPERSMLRLSLQPPLRLDSGIVVRSGASLRRVDVESGRTLWSTPQGEITAWTDIGEAITNGATIEAASHAPLRQSIRRRFLDAGAARVSSDGRCLYVVEVDDGGGPLRRSSPFVRSTRLCAYDALTGRQLWELGGPKTGAANEIPFAGMIWHGPPTLWNGRLVCMVEGGGETRLVVLAPGEAGDDRPSVEWSQSLGSMERNSRSMPLPFAAGASMAVEQGVAYCWDSERCITAIDLDGRRLLWRRGDRADAAVPGHRPNSQRQFDSLLPLQVAEVLFRRGRVIAESAQGHGIEACDAATGESLWLHTAHEIWRIAPTPAGDIVVWRREGIDCLDQEQGTTVWTRSFQDDRLSGGGVVEGRYVLAPVESGELVALALSDGRLVGRSPIGPAGRPRQIVRADGGHDLFIQDIDRLARLRPCETLWNNGIGQPGQRTYDGPPGEVLAAVAVLSDASVEKFDDRRRALETLMTYADGPAPAATWPLALRELALDWTVTEPAFRSTYSPQQWMRWAANSSRAASRTRWLTTLAVDVLSTGDSQAAMNCLMAWPASQRDESLVSTLDAEAFALPGRAVRGAWERSLAALPAAESTARQMELAVQFNAAWEAVVRSPWDPWLAWTMAAVPESMTVREMPGLTAPGLAEFEADPEDFATPTLPQLAPVEWPAAGQVRTRRLPSHRVAARTYSLLPPHGPIEVASNRGDAMVGWSLGLSSVSSEVRMFDADGRPRMALPTKLYLRHQIEQSANWSSVARIHGRRVALALGEELLVYRTSDRSVGKLSLRLPASSAGDGGLFERLGGAIVETSLSGDRRKFAANELDQPTLQLCESDAEFVLIASQRGLEAWDDVEGRLLWRRIGVPVTAHIAELSTDKTSRPDGGSMSGVVVVELNSTIVRRLSTADGHESGRWNLNADEEVMSLTSDEMLTCETIDGAAPAATRRYRRRHPGTGEVAWTLERPAGSVLRTSGRQRLYALSRAGQLESIDRNTGTVAWTARIAVPAEWTDWTVVPRVDGDMAFIHEPTEAANEGLQPIFPGASVPVGGVAVRLDSVAGAVAWSQPIRAAAFALTQQGRIPYLYFGARLDRQVGAGVTILERTVIGTIDFRTGEPLYWTSEAGPVEGLSPATEIAQPISGFDTGNWAIEFDAKPAAE